MLQELAIHDFAIIDHLALSFQPGMTALTGETGAGKSIIIDAVGLLAGGRGSVDFIRTGTTKASLEGLFDAQENPATEAKLQAYGSWIQIKMTPYCCSARFFALAVMFVV